MHSQDMKEIQNTHYEYTTHDEMTGVTQIPNCNVSNTQIIQK